MIMSNLKEKIEECINGTMAMKVEEAVEYVQSLFQENLYYWDKVYESNDFYTEKKLIISLSKENLTQLIIAFPGGDRFGSRISDPYTNIFFYNPLIDRGYELYLFRDNKYNKENKIIEYMEILAEKDRKLDSSELIERMMKTMYTSFYMPMYMLEQIELDKIENSQMYVEVIVEWVSSVVKGKYSMAKEQYEYGRFGGADVAKWKLSEAEQFRKLWKELPRNIESVCHKELERYFRENYI